MTRVPACPRSAQSDDIEDVPLVDDEEMPRLRITRRTLIFGTLFIVLALAFLYFVLPQIAGLDETWHRIEQGDPWWLALALVFTVLSFAGYVALFQYVYVHAGSRVDLRASYQITMASLAATRRVRRRRRGRHRADGVGAAPVGHGGARRRRLDGRLPVPDLRGLHGRAHRRRARAAHRPAPAGRTRSR